MDGFRDAGYVGVHIDDCWETQTPPRDTQGQLQFNQTRFPSGPDALSEYFHSRGCQHVLKGLLLLLLLLLLCFRESRDHCASVAEDRCLVC